MALAEKHPIDKGKYQATYSDFGHGKGNGKSRSMIYKDAKKHKINQDKTQQPEPVPEPEEKPEYTKSREEEVEQESFEDVNWLDEDDGLPAPTIPRTIRKLGEGTDGELSLVHRATQAQLIRWGYMATDRGITHWGRGVMQDEDWEIKRHPSDYDALEASTMHLLDANGITINLSPTLVWGTVVSAAYVPPIRHISKNAKNPLGGRLLSRLGDIIMKPFRFLTNRKKDKPTGLVKDESEN